MDQYIEEEKYKKPPYNLLLHLHPRKVKANTVRFTLTFLALSLTCSHLGCSVAWDETTNQFICPCHASSFNKVGNVLSSPAPRPLDYFPVIIEEGKVKIDVSTKTKRRKFEKKQLTYAL